MKRTVFSCFLSIVCVVVLVFLSVDISADGGKYIDPDIPESWYRAPKTSSELGITEFHQSPMLDERVANGKLSPVEERLPDDPPVMESYNKVGKYGGTVTAWDRLLDYYELGYWNNFGGGRATPDAKFVPSYLKGWEYSNDYKKITLHIRKGLKWSDGHPFTADDYIYWWEHEAQNRDLEPMPPEDWHPPLLNVTSENKWTVTFHYGKPVPHIHLALGNDMAPSGTLIPPAHFMKQFHPDFVGKEKVEQMAKDIGLDEWYEYYDRIAEDSPTHPEYENTRPVLSPFVAVKRTETTLIMERNPYYPFVDPEGNQLPYVDRIRINLANSSEMAATKAATGQATFAARHLRTRDIPLYKRNEKKGNYTTLIYYRAYGAEVGIELNLSHKDPKLRNIFQNVRFRKALSLAIDRKTINQKLYFGKAVPRQATVPPINKQFDKRLAEAYANYDPEQAKQLLDKMGMVDKDGDGYRERPDGETFKPTLIYCKMGPVTPTALLELVRADWKDVGINIDLKMVGRELHDLRWAANEGDISGWTLDQVCGVFFNQLGGLRFFAPVNSASYTQWPGFVNWYTSHGDEGLKPPEEIGKLVDYAETVLYSPDEEKRTQAAVKLLEAQAENIWMIGTVGMGPQAIIIGNKLHNVPKTGLWDSTLGYMEPYHTEQFYIEE